MKKKLFMRIMLISVVMVFSMLIAAGGWIVHYRLNIPNVGRGSDLTLSISKPYGRKDSLWTVSFYGKDEYITCDIHDTTQQKRYRSPLTHDQITQLNTHLFAITRISRLILLKWSWQIVSHPYVRILQEPLVLEDNNPAYAVFDRVIYLANLPTYRVQEGDTLSSIAQHVFGDPTKISKILDVNPNLKGDHLREGLSIRLPQQ